MYKTKINAWNIHKNYKKADKAAIIRDFKRLMATTNNDVLPDEIECDEFTYKGRPVKMHCLIRYLKEKKIDASDSANADIEDNAVALFNEAVSAINNTESPETLVSEVGDFRNTEILLMGAANFMDSYITNIRTKPTPYKHQSRGFTQQMDTVMILESQGRLRRAVSLMNEALDGVVDIVSEQYPTIFSRMFHLFLFEQSKSMLMQSAQRHVMEMANVVLGPEHPVVQACTIIPKLGSEEARLQAWKSFLNVYVDWLKRSIARQQLGSDDPTALRGHLARIAALGRLGMFEEALSDLDSSIKQKLLSQSEYLFRRGQMLIGLGRYQEAECKLNEALELGSHEEQNATQFIVKVLDPLAQVLELQDQHAAARDSHLQSMRLSAQLYGESSLETMLTISTFEKFLRRQEMHGEAEVLCCSHPSLFE